MFLSSAFRRRRAEIAKSRRKADEKPHGDPGTQVHYQQRQGGGGVIIVNTDTHKHRWNGMSENSRF